MNQIDRELNSIGKIDKILKNINYQKEKKHYLEDLNLEKNENLKNNKKRHNLEIKIEENSLLKNFGENENLKKNILLFLNDLFHNKKEKRNINQKEKKNINQKEKRNINQKKKKNINFKIKVNSDNFSNNQNIKVKKFHYIFKKKYNQNSFIEENIQNIEDNYDSDFQNDLYNDAYLNS